MNIAVGINIDLRRRALFCILSIGRIQFHRQLTKVFPTRRLPNHEHPVDVGRSFFGRNSIWIEPETLSRAIVQNDTLAFNIEFCEVG